MTAVKSSMKIIIAPSKKMRLDMDSLPWQELPRFLPQTEQLLEKLRGMSYDELKRLWACNDSIAALNAERLRHMELRASLTPAVLAYEGIQYQYMAPGVMPERALAYLQEHLRILSGFYGVLRPFDGVTPYRLEMQARLSLGKAKDLYSFWGNTLADFLFSETDCVINLASKEYSLCVSRYLPASVRLITCVFGELQNGKLLEKGTLCKMARGEMVRFLAETGAEALEELRGFDRLGYRYSPEYSNETAYVFLKQGNHA